MFPRIKKKNHFSTMQNNVELTIPDFINALEEGEEKKY